MATKDASEPGRPKQVFWMASSRKDLKKFPKVAKPLKGFRGAGVLEIVEDDDGNTYRAVYTVKFAGVVYVLHAFQKKSKSGVSTPTEEIAKVKNRLKQAEKHHAGWAEQQKEEEQGRH
jgi:phage-related protein